MQPSSERLTRLLDEAEALIVKEGFLHLSTAQLAARLHCSKRALYEIAPGAEQFFEVLLARRTARFERQHIAELEKAPDLETAIFVCVESIVASLEQESPVFLRDVMQFPPGARLVRKFQRKITDALVRVIERGEHEHLFRKIEPRVAAEALLVSVIRMIEPDFLAQSPVTSAEAVRQVYQIFAFGLRRLPQTRPIAIASSNGVKRPRSKRPQIR